MARRRGGSRRFLKPAFAPCLLPSKLPACPRAWGAFIGRNGRSVPPAPGDLHPTRSFALLLHILPRNMQGVRDFLSSRPVLV